MTRHTEAELWAIAETILTHRQQTVLRHWLDGHSVNTIARTMNRDESTIRGHLERALRKMKPYLRKDAA